MVLHPFLEPICYAPYAAVQRGTTEHDAGKLVLGLDPGMDHARTKSGCKLFGRDIMLNLLKSITFLRLIEVDQNAS